MRYETLEITDRSYRFRTYKDTFLGNEAVDFFIDRGVAETREEAVDVGNLMVHAEIL